MKKQKKGKCIMQSSGVTLIALIITIIILLILAVTSVALVMRWNIIEKTEMAAEGYQGASEKDAIELAYEEWALNDDENANLNMDGQADVTKNDENGKTKDWTVKFPSGNVYTVDDDGDIWEAVQVTVEGGEEEEEGPVILTEENVKDYLGKVVTNFKTGVGEIETVTVGSEKTGGKQDNVTVSTKYRLYWVDFDNKYGEGNGTIYLKADCTGNKYQLPTTETPSDADDEKTIKIKRLNPLLFQERTDHPSYDNNNMKAVKWLLNTDNWDSLKDSVSDTYKNDVIYIVGAPPLEMMMDSYNTHYGLNKESSQTEQTDAGATDSTSSTRQKLLYQYPYNGNGTHYGYGVGPYSNGSNGGSSGTNGYWYRTSNNTVTSDSSIDSMYYPGSSNYYWLASPSANSYDNVMHVYYYSGGDVSNYSCTNDGAFCPLVCLDSSVPLSLKQGETVPTEE